MDEAANPDEQAADNFFSRRFEYRFAGHRLRFICRHGPVTAHRTQNLHGEF